MWAHNACGPYGKLKTLKGHHRNHLNQHAAYGGVIGRLKGIAVHLTHLQHKLFHRSLNAFWMKHKAADTRPTNGQYGRAVRQALIDAGLSKAEASRLAALARKQRLSFGLGDAEFVPRMPEWP